jgi:hypothetical protein
MKLLARLRRRRAVARQRQPLHVCAVCRSTLLAAPLVQSWDERRSLVVLSCAECGHERTGLFGADAVTLFSAQQDAAAYALRRSLEGLPSEGPDDLPQPSAA